MCVAASVVSRQYIRIRDSSCAHLPTCREPSSGTSIGMSSFNAGNVGSAETHFGGDIGQRELRGALPGNDPAGGFENRGVIDGNVYFSAS
jgi:hypothetical protein